MRYPGVQDGLKQSGQQFIVSFFHFISPFSVFLFRSKFLDFSKYFDLDAPWSFGEAEKRGGYSGPAAPGQKLARDTRVRTARVRAADGQREELEKADASPVACVGH
jgi:hypothetical protein